MKRFSFLMLMFALLGFVACEQDKPLPDAQDGLVLSADVESITADGMSVANFTVKLNNEVVTSDCYIYNVESGEPLSGSFFTSTTEGRYSFYATRGSMKSNTVVIDVLAAGETPAEKVAVLSVSKSEIISNGTDTAIFVVSVDNEDVTNDAKIYLESSNQPLEGNIFTTTEEGTYKFFAEMEGAKRSQSVTVVAKAEPVVEEKPIELSASVDTIRANGVDAVAFTVKQEGNIVTDACTIYVDGAKLNGSRFLTFAAGTYTFYAVKGSVTSNEVVVTAEEVTDTGKTVLFAEGVSITSGWYDVNKKSTPSSAGADAMMCWAAVSSNIAQWFQDRYVAAGNTLPDGCPNGTSSSYGYELQIMDVFRDNWDNLAKGCWPDGGLVWYFEGRDLYSTMNDSNRAHPRSGTGGYFAAEWSTIFEGMYHNEAGSYVAEINNYSWRGGVDDPLKRFSEYVIDAFEHGMSGMAVAISSNFSGGHAVTIWGYEVDNATGYVTKLYIADSDDGAMPTLAPYTVRSDSGNAKIALVGHTTYYPMALYPVSGYNSATK